MSNSNIITTVHQSVDDPHTIMTHGDRRSAGNMKVSQGTRVEIMATNIYTTAKMQAQ